MFAEKQKYMAVTIDNIIGKVLYFHEMGPITVSGNIETPIHIHLSSDDGQILDESYWPGFDGTVSIDLVEIVSPMFRLSIPKTDEDTLQSEIAKVFHINLNQGEIVGSFTINGFSKDAKTRISDIDSLRIPSDYRLPLTLHNFTSRTGIGIQPSDSELFYINGLETSASGVGAVSRMVEIDKIAELSGQKSFHIVLECYSQPIYSPIFEICNGDFEQYLFMNRYGGFDNIPMDGQREFQPDMSFESGLFGNTNQQVEASAEYVYSQNSGFVSRTILELAGELLCSPQIYHLDKKSGEFRPIIITESTLASKSKDSLHSFSFKYKYADGSRPATLKGGYIGQENRSAGSQPTLMYPINGNPMIIAHNRNKYPDVTVVDTSLKEVGVSVEYPDKNTVIISWNGNLEGYIYIN